jgi:hypothetical protein
MRHLMPIITPRLILRPPTLGDLDSIQTAKEEAWPDLQRWMSWAFDNQQSRRAMEDSIRRVMDYPNQAGIALAGFHRINQDFVVPTALDLTDADRSVLPIRSRGPTSHEGSAASGLSSSTNSQLHNRQRFFPGQR